jgi:hypothetical protein
MTLLHVEMKNLVNFTSVTLIDQFRRCTTGTNIGNARPYTGSMGVEGWQSVGGVIYLCQRSTHIHPVYMVVNVLCLYLRMSHSDETSINIIYVKLTKFFILT